MMKLKTHAFVAKQFAKKHYADAVDSIKTLKTKIKTKIPKLKSNFKSSSEKVKTFASKNKTSLKVAAGSSVAGGTVGAYAGNKSGRKKELTKARNYVQMTGLGVAASELGIKGPAHKTTSAQRVKITNKYYSNVKKRAKQRKDFYLG